MYLCICVIVWIFLNWGCPQVIWLLLSCSISYTGITCSIFRIEHVYIIYSYLVAFWLSCIQWHYNMYIPCPHLTCPKRWATAPGLVEGRNGRRNGGLSLPELQQAAEAPGRGDQERGVPGRTGVGGGSSYLGHFFLP
jgi:hypothetical protein